MQQNIDQMNDEQSQMIAAAEHEHELLLVFIHSRRSVLITNLTSHHLVFADLITHVHG